MKTNRMLTHLIWILLVFSCVCYAFLRLFGKYTVYESGLHLEPFGFGHPVMGSFILLAISLVAALTFALFLVSRLFSSPAVSRWYLLTLTFLPLAWLVGERIRIPSYLEGLSVGLAQPTLLSAFSAAAAAEISKSSEPGVSPEVVQMPPFDALQRIGTPYKHVLEDTWILEFGGSLSFNWGIAVSGKASRKPALPANLLEIIPLNEGICIFSFKEF